MIQRRPQLVARIPRLIRRRCMVNRVVNGNRPQHARVDTVLLGMREARHFAGQACDGGRVARMSESDGAGPHQ